VKRGADTPKTRFKGVGRGGFYKKCKRGQKPRSPHRDRGVSASRLCRVRLAFAPNAVAGVGEGEEKKEGGRGEREGKVGLEREDFG